MERTLADVDAELVIAYASRKAALQAEAYRVDSGQGNSSVTRNLIAIQKIIKDLEAERRELAANGGGPLYMELCR